MATSSTYNATGAAKVAALIVAASWWVQSGTGTTAAAKTQTALVTASAAAHACTNGSGHGVLATTTDANDTVTFVSTTTETGAITEVGVFDASGGSGTAVMLQRHVFDAINVASGDSIEFTIKHQQVAA